MLTQLQDIYYGRQPHHPWTVDIQTGTSLHQAQSLVPAYHSSIM